MFEKVLFQIKLDMLGVHDKTKDLMVDLAGSGCLTDVIHRR